VHRDELLERCKTILEGTDCPLKDSTFVRHLNHSEEIVAIGSTGRMTLKEWGENTESIKDFLLNALDFFDHACSPDMILSFAEQQKRTDINKRTLEAYASQNFLRLTNGKYILPEWKERYLHIGIRPKQTKNIVPVKTNRYRDAGIFLLKEAADGQMPLNVFVKSLTQQFDVISQTFYKLATKENCFTTFSAHDDRKWIKLSHEYSDNEQRNEN